MDSGKNLLMPGVSKREVLAWASYDFANSGYTTVILTAVYNAFFVSVVAENAVWATFAWTLTITLSNLLSIAVIPVISALADAKANKRFWLAVMTGARRPLLTQVQELWLLQSFSLSFLTRRSTPAFRLTRLFFQS